METIAVPCDGKVECQDSADESWLCTQQSVIVYVIHGKGSQHKKNYETLDIVQKGGRVSGAAKLFIEIKYGHVLERGVDVFIQSIFFFSQKSMFLIFLNSFFVLN